MNDITNNSLDLVFNRIKLTYQSISQRQFRQVDKDLIISDIQFFYSEIKKIDPNFKLEHNIEDDISKATPEESFTDIDIQLEQQIENKTQPIHQIIVDSPPPVKPIVQTSFDSSPPPIKIVAERIIEEPKIDSSEINPQIILEENHLPEEIEQIAHEPVQIIPTEIAPEIIIEEVKIEDIEIVEVPITPIQTNFKDIYDFLDINTRIGLLELFFKGNSNEMSNTLASINQQKSKADCIHLAKNVAQLYNVKETDDIFETMITLINRKFL